MWLIVIRNLCLRANQIMKHMFGGNWYWKLLRSRMDGRKTIAIWLNIQDFGEYITT